MNKIIPAAAVLSFSLLLTGCGGSTGSSTPTAAQAPAAAPTSAAPVVDKASEIKICDEATATLQETIASTLATAFSAAADPDVDQDTFLKETMNKMFGDIAAELKKIETPNPDSPVAVAVDGVIKETEALSTHPDPENFDEKALDAVGADLEKVCTDAGWVAPKE